MDCPASPEARRWLDQVAVEHPVFELRPDYTALVIVAEGLRPGPSDEATDALLREAEAQATDTLAAIRTRSPRWPDAIRPGARTAPRPPCSR